MMFAITVFVVSLLSMAVLFALKYMELRKGAVFIRGVFVDNVNRKIVELEGKFENVRSVSYLARMFKRAYHGITHCVAKFTAGMAKKIEWRARTVAHKTAKKAGINGGAVRENQYLKDIREYKEYLRSGSDNND